MRLSLHATKIIKKYSKKKPKKNQYILLLSSIVQLVYLDYPNYAVINCSVELAKHKKINAIPKYINGILKKIDKNKDELKKTKLDKEIFLNLSNHSIFDDLKLQKKIKIFESIAQKPEIHIVFKKKELISNNFYKLKKSTNTSGVLNINNSLTNIEEFKKGFFWIQDFSAMLPIFLINNLKNCKVLDMCSAPGGKTFQLIQAGANVTSVEKYNNRAKD
jgi:tRNA and rRNA cytosine-C5-methylases